jgi:hypothetical protein
MGAPDPAVLALEAASAAGTTAPLTGGQLDVTPHDFLEVTLVLILCCTMWCLPSCCRSLPPAFCCARYFKSFFSRNLWVYGRITAVLSAALILWMLQDVETVTINEFFFSTVEFFSVFLDSLYQLLITMLIIVAIVLLVGLKDRIFMFFGVERGESVVRYKWWDVLTCGCYNRFQVIEVFIWRLENLPMSSTNVFVEARLGYNEAMVTRVHQDTADRCLIRESIQLNFDSSNQNEHLILLVKNQGLVASEQLCRVSISSDEINQLILETGWDCPTKYDPALWDRRYFREFLMVPQGTIYLRVAYVTDSDDTYWRTLFTRWTSWDYWTHPSEYRRYERTTDVMRTDATYPLHATMA